MQASQRQSDTTTRTARSRTPSTQRRRSHASTVGENGNIPSGPSVRHFATRLSWPATHARPRRPPRAFASVQCGSVATRARRHRQKISSIGLAGAIGQRASVLRGTPTAFKANPPVCGSSATSSRKTQTAGGSSEASAETVPVPWRLPARLSTT